MFYSQTYLARKGPLGTVWCAAHLQHRLRKSHYTSTDISSTVGPNNAPQTQHCIFTYIICLCVCVRVNSCGMNRVFGCVFFFFFGSRNEISLTSYPMLKILILFIHEPRNGLKLRTSLTKLSFTICTFHYMCLSVCSLRDE